MAHDYVKDTCDDLGVCTEEALSYLEGFKWDFDAAMEACGNKTFPSVNVDPSPSKPQTTTESSGVLNQTPEKQPLNEIRIPLMGSPQLQDSLETESASSSRNRWSTYVKRCHEMILFLTAATLAYLPIRYVIDDQREYGTQVHLEDYIRVIARFLGGINMVDPFLFLALAYTVSYIVASASLSRSKVQIAELVSIFFGFGMVFLVIFYISPITFLRVCLGLGLFIGAITIREFCLARRDS